MFKLLLSSLLLAGVLASPLEVIERGLSCNAIDTIISIMHAQAVATPFCSSLLSISTVSSATTSTITPPVVAVTSTVSSLTTVTSVSTSTISTVTTVGVVPVVTVTSTCALGATTVDTTSSAAASTTTVNAKRNPNGNNNKPCTTSTTSTSTSSTSCKTTSTSTSTSTTSSSSISPPPQTSTAIGTPTCLKGYGGASITSACSCLSIPTPTWLAVSTTTLPASTTTLTTAVTAQVTVTSVTTTQVFTSTTSVIAGTNTQTYTILPQPTQTASPPDGEVYGVYSGTDFPGMDIKNFFCYSGGPAPPAPFPSCASFSDCISECAYYNDNGLGSALNETCGTVSYNAAPDGSSASCYLKTGQVGCGSQNSQVTSGVLLPLMSNDVQ